MGRSALINAAGYCCAFPSPGVLTQAMQRGNDEVLFWCIDGTFDDTVEQVLLACRARRLGASRG